MTVLLLTSHYSLADPLSVETVHSTLENRKQTNRSRRPTTSRHISTATAEQGQTDVITHILANDTENFRDVTDNSGFSQRALHVTRLAHAAYVTRSTHETEDISTKLTNFTAAELNYVPDIHLTRAPVELASTADDPVGTAKNEHLTRAPAELPSTVDGTVSRATNEHLTRAPVELSSTADDTVGRATNEHLTRTPVELPSTADDTVSRITNSDVDVPPKTNHRRPIYHQTNKVGLLHSHTQTRTYQRK